MAAPISWGDDAAPSLVGQHGKPALSFIKAEHSLPSVLSAHGAASCYNICHDPCNAFCIDYHTGEPAHKVPIGVDLQPYVLSFICIKKVTKKSNSVRGAFTFASSARGRSIPSDSKNIHQIDMHARQVRSRTAWWKYLSKQAIHSFHVQMQNQALHRPHSSKFWTGHLWDCLDNLGGGMVDICCRLSHLVGRRHQIRSHLAFMGHPLAGKPCKDLKSFLGWSQLKEQVMPSTPAQQHFKATCFIETFCIASRRDLQADLLLFPSLFCFALIFKERGFRLSFLDAESKLVEAWVLWPVERQ